MVGKEQQTFAVHENVISPSKVLEVMCRAKVERREDYRIELPDVDPYTFEGILAWMYEFSIDRPLECPPEGEGRYVGDLYIFAVQYDMEVFRDTLMERMERHHDLRDLLETAMRVYSVLGRETLFSLFFTAHVIEKISTHCSKDLDFRPEVNIEEMLAKGGDFGADLMEAMLRAMFADKLSLSAAEQPMIIPPSQQNDSSAFFRSKSRPYVRNATAIALRDWDGEDISTLSFPILSFPTSARTTNVVRDPSPRL